MCKTPHDEHTEIISPSHYSFTTTTTTQHPSEHYTTAATSARRFHFQNYFPASSTHSKRGWLDQKTGIGNYLLQEATAFKLNWRRREFTCNNVCMCTWNTWNQQKKAERNVWHDTYWNNSGEETLSETDDDGTFPFKDELSVCRSNMISCLFYFSSSFFIAIQKCD